MLEKRLSRLENLILERSMLEAVKPNIFSKNINAVKAAVEDGIENDNGDPMLRFYLFADYKAFSRYMRNGDTRASLFELTYSFRDDGLYEDDDYFNGTTEKDLIDAVAESFAKSLYTSEY